MAISGRFEADFSQYVGETQKATRELQTLEGQSRSVVKATDAIGASGTTFGPLNTAATTTTSTFGQLAAGLSTTDKTLALMGVHIGPEIRAIAELGTVATGSATALGLMGTAAAALTTFLAGWKIGEKISEWTGLGDAIANASAKLFGFGDVAAQTAGAQQDVLDRASGIVKRTVTDIVEARAIIDRSLAGMNAQWDNSATRIANWSAELRKVESEGNLPKLAAEIKSHNSTLEQMSREYGASTEAISFYTRQLATADAAQKEAAASAQKLLDAQQQFTTRQVNAADELTGINDLKAATELLEAIELQHIDVRNLTIESQAMVNDVLLKGVAAAVQLGMATDPLTSRFEAVRLTATEASRAIAELTAAQEAAAAAAAALAKQEKDLNDAMLEAYKRSGGTTPGDFDTGIQSSGTGRAAQAPSVFARWGINHPNYDTTWRVGDDPGPIPGVMAPRGSGATIQNVFNVNGTGEDIARRVSEILTRDAMVGNPWAVTR